LLSIILALYFLEEGEEKLTSVTENKLLEEESAEKSQRSKERGGLLVRGVGESGSQHPELCLII
jgi:hypothetical protein